MSNTLRLAVLADDGRISCTWRVWTGEGKKTTDETYIAPRPSAAHLKVSIHSSGYCQHALNYDSKLVAHLPGGVGRHQDQWQLGSEVAPGWRPAFQITFSESELRPAGDDLPHDVTFIAPPPPHESLEVGIFILSVGTETPSYLNDEVRPVSYLRRASGGAVAVVAMLAPPLDPLLIPQQRSMLLNAASTLVEFPEPLSTTETYAWAFGEGALGGRRAIEFAMTAS